MAREEPWRRHAERERRRKKRERRRRKEDEDGPVRLSRCVFAL
jgi:hypothetical protein